MNFANLQKLSQSRFNFEDVSGCQFDRCPCTCKQKPVTNSALIKTPTMKFGTLISVKQLTEALCKSPKNLRILDSTWHMPGTNRDPLAEYAEEHIPGALFFDISDCCDKKSEYEHMLPSSKEFEKYAGKLGINNETHVILYDNNEMGLFSAPRVWWTFRIFGHNAVSILNGGFPNWKVSGQPVTKEVKTVDTEIFNANFNPAGVKSFDDILRNIQDKGFQMADARPSGRFYGIDPEPRPGTSAF